ncbi:hypothetical protein [Flagellimonas allohymeniacidonis]|uniref:Lipocalin-like domain-containing protein n=1 Tax=Flagellimonas allohymeniacidonis TaxID=2517819 RepID=A0A4V6MMB1_9FLAO|nr:hypothetical protein [Allomuricauda hymeniacidonis]TAI48800.1 hypothetical protein EW142_03100 [Allomuricauda hymeniacidonis]
MEQLLYKLRKKAMKNCKLLWGCTFLLTILSCNVDDGVEDADPLNFDVIGLWDLVEVNINPGQDLNNDGTASSNLMNELDCISGTLLIDGDFVWTLEQTDLTITPITGDQFNIDCSETVIGTGTWFADQSAVGFGGNAALSFLTISGDRLFNQIGQDLPGIQSYVYQRRAQ